MSITSCTITVLEAEYVVREFFAVSNNFSFVRVLSKKWINGDSGIGAIFSGNLSKIDNVVMSIIASDTGAMVIAVSLEGLTEVNVI